MRKPTQLEIIVVAAATSILGLWVFWAMCGVSIAHQFLNGAPPIESGAWGDSFGSFNALVSALGFAGILITLMFQIKAMRRQQDDTLSQSEEQHRQQFDRAFFELMRLTREIRSEIFFKYSTLYVTASGRTATKTAHGPEALSRAAREVAYWIREREKKGALSAENLSRIYTLKVHIRAETRLGPYYRTIYTILRRISEDKVLTSEEKSRYGNLLRSQLQSREVLLLALNGLTPISGNLKDYLIEFRIMKYLPSKALNLTLQRAGYPKEAFEARD